MPGLLESIQTPADLRRLPLTQLPRLAEEIRERIVSVVSKRGGHLASNLGVVELTIALHYCFDFPRDRLIWDVGHQCYPHKLLTGRNDRFDTLRQAGGLCGFPDARESEYDVFHVGHAGTAIATAVGLACGDARMGRTSRVVAVVGDASIANGLSFEGLNQAALLERQLLIVLNDNRWGISQTRGALAEYLAKFRVSGLYEEVKEKVKTFLPRLPVLGKPVFDALDHLKEGIKATVSPHQIFEQMGFTYVGPIDGHDLAHLIELLNLIKDFHRPLLLHVHTQKGRGCPWALADPGKFHSPRPFVIEGDKVTMRPPRGTSWTATFADALIEQARRNEKVFAITAAMPDGTGLAKFAEVFADRFLDVGIAESCAVAVAAGLAKAGLRPVVAVYSTFLQRAFDQIYQEVCLQGLPVIFAIDRAGLVGEDGAVHHGFLDISYLRGLPGMVLMAPADALEMNEALALALKIDQPCAIRYPRDSVPAPHAPCPAFALGRSRLMREGQDATVLAYGAVVQNALDAADLLAADAESPIDLRVINARFAAPLDRAMVAVALRTGRPVVTVEDHSLAGGFGSAVLETAQELGLPTDRIMRLGLPTDRFIQHGQRSGQLAEVGIDAAGIASAVRRAVDDSGGPVRRAVPQTQPLRVATHTHVS